MVRNHVAQSTGAVVIPAAPLDAERFGDGDLDMIDIAAVPDRLENPVGKTKYQDVLDGFLAEVMVDPVDLLFFENLADFFVQSPGRFQIRPERLFDNDPPPVLSLFRGQALFAELADDLGEELRQRREVIKVRSPACVALRPVRRFYPSA